jgi:putative restriction endonuclease
VADKTEEVASSDTGPEGLPQSETETQRMQNVRLGQSFFRKAVLVSYNDRCCVCLLPCKALLVASHIIPWAIRPQLRLDPRNGLCLCAMHDRAFDRGLISVDCDFRIAVSRHIEDSMPHNILEAMFIDFRDKSIHLPEKFRPNPEHLSYRRSTIFQEG